MELVGEEFVYLIIDFTAITNCNSSFNVFFLCSLYAAFISESTNFSLYVISVLWSIDGWVIHFVVIEIHINVPFYFDITTASLRVILWGSIFDLYFLTGKSELIIVVYVTILIVGKAAVLMIYQFRQKVRTVLTVGFYVLCLMICIFEESLETSR